MDGDEDKMARIKGSNAGGNEMEDEISGWHSVGVQFRNAGGVEE